MNSNLKSCVFCDKYASQHYLGIWCTTEESDTHQFTPQLAEQSSTPPARAVRQAWDFLPETYRRNRASYDFNEKTSMFDVTSGGYGIAQSEDSEVAHFICVALNSLWEKK